MPTSSELRPTSPDEVGAALAEAGERPVLIRGRGTKLDWGGPAVEGSAVVDLSGLDGVLEHAAGDLVAAVQPGVTLARLAEVLAPAGQRLALDEVVPGSTIGGAIATGLAGPLRATFGSVRDLILGVTVTLADGRIAKSGGRVVKNVAGYDLAKLYTGSFGTLGVVTSAWLRLHPVPGRQAWLDLGEAPASAALAPTAVEVHDDGHHRRHVALIEGSETGVAARVASSRLPEVARPAWWGRIPGLGTQATIVKLTTVRTGVPGLLEVARRAGVPVEVAGSVATGVLWAGVDGDAPVDRVVDAVRDLRRVTAAEGGAAVVLRTSPAVRAAVDAWGPVPALALMRRVKDRFDPGHRLAPGRFVGGI